MATPGTAQLISSFILCSVQIIIKSTLTNKSTEHCVGIYTKIARMFNSILFPFKASHTLIL